MKTIWTNAHAPKKNEYILELDNGKEVTYRELVVNGEVQSFRIEDSLGGLITDQRIIRQVCDHISKNPGPPKG